MEIRGTLKAKVDAIWQDFYNENMAQVSEIVNQLTTLMFIKMLDDKQNAIEARAAVANIPLDDKDLIFKSGEYQNYQLVPKINKDTGEIELDEKGNPLSEKQLNFKIPYADLRWKNFKNLNSFDLAKRIKDYVIPFIKDPNNKEVGKFSKYAKKYAFGFDDKERLLTSVVDKLSDKEFDFNNLDVMGDVYEYMCGSGISGQYRTPRHIIDMAVEMMKPKLGQKIIDPAMGTAGFLVESAKYIQNHQHEDMLNVKNSKLFSNEMFFGCDNDPNMARIGYMNNILHGIKNPIITMDSLLEYENAKDYLGKFDLVLANPPFSGSLVESAINGKILKITKTKKTELLFVALMDMLLKPGGKCMTIVPDGVLFGEDNAHKSLRAELVDKQKLIAVISMPNGIFSAPAKKGSSSKGAAVKTSFLIFEKTDKANSTSEVWFYNMENDGYSLTTNRVPIEENDIPDIISRFNSLENEHKRTRKDKSFFVDVDEIRKNKYDLTFDNYKSKEVVIKEFRSSKEIFDDLINVQEKIMNAIVSLKNGEFTND